MRRSIIDNIKQELKDLSFYLTIVVHKRYTEFFVNTYYGEEKYDGTGNNYKLSGTIGYNILEVYDDHVYKKLIREIKNVVFIARQIKHDAITVPIYDLDTARNEIYIDFYESQGDDDA